MALVCDRCESKKLVEPLIVSLGRRSSAFGTSISKWSKGLDLCDKCRDQLKNQMIEFLKNASK